MKRNIYLPLIWLHKNKDLHTLQVFITNMRSYHFKSIVGFWKWYQCVRLCRPSAIVTFWLTFSKSIWYAFWKGWMVITRVIVILNFQLVGHWQRHVEQTVQDGLHNEFICMDAIDRDGMGPYFVKYNSKPHNVVRVTR